MRKYKTGEIVRLKGGSPALTVSIHDYDEVLVLWFHDGEIHEKTLPEFALEPSTPDIRVPERFAVTGHGSRYVGNHLETASG